MVERSRIFERIDGARKAAFAGHIPSVRERRKILRRLLILLVSHRDAACAVLNEDLGRSRQGALAVEILPLIREIKKLIRRLPKLTARSRSAISFLNWPGRGCTVPQPYGHVLIVCSWNFPLLQALELIAGAYAAGNHVVLKLPVRAPKSAQFIRWLVEETFVGDEVISVDDEADLDDLLALKFDYVFAVCDKDRAVEIREKTAKDLTPCDFIIGGKSPAVVDEKAFLSAAARRIVQGKFFNAGQSRIAPELVFVHDRVRERFKQAVEKVVRQTYGSDPLSHVETGRIIDQEAYGRLNQLTGQGRLVCGGEKMPEELKIAPTVIDRLSAEDSLVTEDICGPILPLVSFSSEEDLICKLKNIPRMPAVYYFGSNRSVKRRLLKEIQADSLVFNDAGMQFFNKRVAAKDVFSQFVRPKEVMSRPVYPALPWRSLPLRRFWNLILEYMVKWSI